MRFLSDQNDIQIVLMAFFFFRGRKTTLFNLFFDRTVKIGGIFIF